MTPTGDQLDMLDGWEAPPPVHRDGPDTEKLAADKLAPTAKKWREVVRDLVTERGRRGATGWEAIVTLGMQEHQSTVRTRLTELTTEKHGAVLTATSERRANRNGNAEVVYVATKHL